MCNILKLSHLAKLLQTSAVKHLQNDKASMSSVFLPLSENDLKDPGGYLILRLSLLGWQWWL